MLYALFGSKSSCIRSSRPTERTISHKPKLNGSNRNPSSQDTFSPTKLTGKHSKQPEPTNFSLLMKRFTPVLPIDRRSSSLRALQRIRSLASLESFNPLNWPEAGTLWSITMRHMLQGLWRSGVVLMATSFIFVSPKFVHGFSPQPVAIATLLLPSEVGCGLPALEHSLLRRLWPRSSSINTCNLQR